ncbi:nascent polypeptide-associated complex protein [Halodesulfurarchaeum formicicum]|uniref:Nascent polypeptide-associated complex protein n=1 Tax=Halodesulfurarchaeum formicicum TaxID=1873524 RepID=A0A1D8S575_9EURY|nr:nascent polypeptide-associated complex protein [Halodesulfurarchaeum formicicum]AOW80499.1 nascent polypeptide-associated complex protein [Halodesulfurarchaeum formicicum]
MFGGGGMNPRKMEQLMDQMGIDLDELDAVEATITLEDGTKLYFDDPEVTRMDAQGQETYQVVGEPEELEAESEEGESPAESGTGVPEADVEIVAERAGVPTETARQALEAADGDLAAAIDDLE